MGDHQVVRKLLFLSLGSFSDPLPCDIGLSVIEIW